MPVSLAQASPSHRAIAAKTAKPDLSYFAGKTITFVAPGSVGGANYDAVAVLVPGMEAYLHATITLNSQPLGNTIPGQDLAFSSPPNGLTIGLLGPPGDLEDDLKGVTSINFPLKKAMATLLGAIPGTDDIMFAKTGSGITSLAALQKLTTPVSICDQTTGITDVFERVVVGALGLHVSILTGFSSAGAIYSGFISGDCALAVEPGSVVQTAITSGIAVPIMNSAPPVQGSPLYSYLKNVPTMAEYAKQHPFKNKSVATAYAEGLAFNAGPDQVYFAPQGTPEKYLLALQDAVKYALRLTSTKTQMVADGLTPGYISAAQEYAAISSDIKYDSTLTKYLG